MHACDLGHQALGCAYGDKIRQVLERTVLWNGQHWHINKELPRRTQDIQAGCMCLCVLPMCV